QRGGRKGGDFPGGGGLTGAKPVGRIIAPPKARYKPMMFTVKSILPRVALYYWQNICAPTTTFLASAGSNP
ncbi:hypothetical protein ACVGWB_00195, partial [Enterobacter mori]